ncbi:hypothetical protein [Rhodohalobacter barkolensis]|jgi:hypothetical protein|nr:hypothetical protein [Rhodohalobacter barkolensis]
MGNKDTEHDEEFRPKGAVAFFILLMIFFSVVWFALYFELMGRI